MLRLANLSLPLDYTLESLLSLLSRKLRIPPAEITEASIVRKSIDARDKTNVHFVVSVDLTMRNEALLLRKKNSAGLLPVTPYTPPTVPRAALSQPPVIVGAGPAGLFAALILATAGASPIVVERGSCVEKRMQDVQDMCQRGILNPESNVQFGEGGAGTFSDGKLTTGIKSPWQRYVLETFVTHGAPEDVLIDQKPHIGTDLLRNVIRSLRQTIISLGGTFLFDTRMDSLLLHKGSVAGIRAVSQTETRDLLTDHVLLCIGHSSRDTLEHLYAQEIRMLPKPFAMGVRIEHLQREINRAQYGDFADDPHLGAAPYKLHVTTPDGRGVYSFFMCPGGSVMPASSEPGRLCIYGMSVHARDGQNANSALLVGIPVSDFPSAHPLSGMFWQREMEEKAYRLGGGQFIAGAQRVEDFLRGQPSSRFGEVIPSYLPGVIPSDLRTILPDFMATDLAYALPLLDKQLHGFAAPDAVMTGIEARSSSPVRLERGADGQSVSTPGLYPCGEGAGYAGGIVSAAVDGIVQALQVLKGSQR